MGRLPAFARALLAGEAAELLAPARFLAPGSMPAGATRPAERTGVARGLAIANAAYGHPRAAELAAKLADPATRVIATGQQTGLFGGPLLALTKAAAAVRWAEALEAAGSPAVAVFWMATEDHDWNEASAATFLAPDGPRAFRLGDDPQPLAPIGLRTVGPAVEPLLAELATLFPSEWFRAHLETLARFWRPEARFGEAFARTHVALLGARAPLYLDALLPELKAAERPHLARLVERRQAHAEAVARAEQRVVAGGFALQVPSQPGASPLFLLRDGARRKVEWRGADEFAVRGETAAARPIAALRETIADNPAVVSPGVLARPAIQDAVLGTELLLLGPSELAYLPQVIPAYETLGIEPPWIALRPQAMVLDSKSREHLAGLGLSLAELLADPDAATRRLGERAGGDFVAPLRAEVAERLAALEPAALALDANLGKPYAKTRDAVLSALDAFAAKVAQAAARRAGDGERRLEQLRQLVLPAGALQERQLATAWFAGKFGADFASALADGLELDPRRLAVIVP
jgi:bacillithiol biosynthesis cysteine-adding enzyme BshC